jgi:purine-nucleoside phosphorylase
MGFSITTYLDQVNRAAAYLTARLGPLPDTAIQLGTGLGAFADRIEAEQVIAYRDIPGFPQATVPSHHGSLIVGTVNGRRLIVLSGRFHYYEGYTTKEVTLPIRVLQVLGLRRLLITNAAGGLNPAFRPGSIMIIRDHLNFLGENPLRGPNVEAWGPRFPDFSQAYPRHLIELALASAKQCGLADLVTTGVYVCIPGPSLETPAETRWLRNCGADAVGMSSVPEVIVAHHGGLEIIGLSVVSNVNDPDNFQPLSLAAIIEEAAAIEPKLERLVREIITRLHPSV